MKTLPILTLVLALVLTNPVPAAGQEPSPAQLAAESEVVVVAQLERVDYQHRRGFPVEGRAWFRVLLPYKTPRPMERLIVHEEGMKEIECYFPDNPTAIEQPRYLLFLSRDENSRLRGHPAGCALEVLVTANNQYALRWPQAGLVLDEQGLDLVAQMRFHGPLSRVEAGDETRTAREARAERDFMRIDGTDLYYTRGILLGDFRRLMAEGLTADDRLQQRHQRIMEALEDESQP